MSVFLLICLIEIVRQQIAKRSIRVFTGIGRQLRQGDLSDDGLLNKYELEKSLVDFHISIPQEVSCMAYYCGLSCSRNVLPFDYVDLWNATAELNVLL